MEPSTILASVGSRRCHRGFHEQRDTVAAQAMPVRATKRGAERTPFPSGASYDVVICGASFAGLAVARELRASRARVLVLDRYEIGERQTSACAAPTEWLVNLGLEGSIRQTFGSLVVNTPHVHVRWTMPWTFSTFDYRELCRLLWEQCGDAQFETAKVDGRTRRGVVHTDRGDVTAPLLVDALGWRRVLGAGDNFQPPTRRSRAAWRCTRAVRARPRAVDRPAVRPRRATAGRSRRATSCAIGVGSFDPRSTSRSRPCSWPTTWTPSRTATRATGSPTACAPAVEDGVFFAGDSAGHCLPLTAEGIRTALYFGIACGRELARCSRASATRDGALARYGAFSPDTAANSRGCCTPSAPYGTRTAGRWTRWRDLLARPRIAHWALPAVSWDRTPVFRTSRAGAGPPSRSARGVVGPHGRSSPYDGRRARRPRSRPRPRAR